MPETFPNQSVSDRVRAVQLKVDQLLVTIDDCQVEVRELIDGLRYLDAPTPSAAPPAMRWTTRGVPEPVVGSYAQDTDLTLAEDPAPIAPGVAVPVVPVLDAAPAAVVSEVPAA
jgi:hypothetical protein